jgi:hypothetical protein
MGILGKLIKAAISALLLNKAMRSAFLAALIKSVKWILQPSRRSLFKGAVELLLMQFAKKGGFLGKAALSALVALLLNMFRERGEKAGTSSRRQTGRIIDHDNYTILDEGH